MLNSAAGRIADLDWRLTTIDAVVLAFTRAERHKIAFASGLDRQLIDSPDLRNPLENERRRRILHPRRGPLLQRVPDDTVWHDVRYLESRHLDELLAIGRCDWDDPSDRNELRRVATRRRLPLKVPPDEWDEPILWGHDRSGPFTILEGNHRLTAYAGSADPPALRIRAYIGLSPGHCIWHLPDPLH